MSTEANLGGHSASRSAAPLRVPSDPMHLAHPPGALWEHDASEPDTPLLERLPIRASKRLKLDDGLKEHLPLSASDGKGRVSVPEELEARGSSIRGKTPHARGTEDTPAPRFHLGAGRPSSCGSTVTPGQSRACATKPALTGLAIT